MTNMNQFFVCKNGQNVSWTSVCDGYIQCIDGSDEQNCYCQGDIYPCLQGNNVSCRLACTTYGRVTCLTYQNTRACEQYIREYSRNHINMSSIGESSILMNDLDLFRYSAYLAIGILLFVLMILLIMYLIRKKLSKFFFVFTNKSSSTNVNRKSSNRLSSISVNSSRSRYTPASDINDFPPSYSYSDQNITDSYEPPPYPGPQLFSSLHRSDSIYYEIIKTPTISNSMSMLNPMPLPEPYGYTTIRTYSV